VGCKFSLPEAGGADAVLGEGICYGADNGLVRPCYPVAPTGDLTLPGTLDTDTSTLCGAPLRGGNGYCVVAANNITLDDSVVATGSKPLVLVAASTITIESGATLDVASRHSTFPPRKGAGAGSTDCTAGTPPTVSGGGGGGGGGAGGSFGGAGGRGGAGNNGAGTGGSPGAVQVPTFLRGGCPGQDGINGTPGMGGKGGGAVYLIASRISISGAIKASGEGGHPGLTGSAGGGGGGSGGMIGLDAPMITNFGDVFANGASGGEGSGPATPGNLGPEPTSTAASPPPMSGTNNGGDGGGGSGIGIPTGRNGSNGSGGGSPGGGGGGGGGLGVIKVYRGTSTGNVSPMPTR
jgi:hypothetical protein